MILSQLNYGLGNQLFQAAMGYVLASKQESSLRLIRPNFDPKVQNQHSKYRLRCFPNAHRLSRHHIYGKVMRRILNARRMVHLSPGYSPEMHHPEDLGTRNLYCCGYFQSHAYLTGYENKLREFFMIDHAYTSTVLKSKFGSFLAENRELVAVHCRRGDYLSIGEALERDYYLRAIDRMKQSVEEPVFLLFCEDEAWSQQICKNSNNFHYVSFGDDPRRDDLEFCLMRLCTHFIIANSTFSWWAAFLSEFPEKKVLVPPTWFKSKDLATDKVHIVPPSWEILNTDY